MIDRTDQLRLDGLKAFYRGDFTSALLNLKQAAKAIRTNHPNTEKESMCLLEVGKAFAENGLSQQAQQSFAEALSIAKSTFGAKAAITLKVMKEYANFLRKQGKTEESASYDTQADFSLLNGTDDMPIGTAKVEKDGTVLLSLNADGPEFRGHASIAYAPSNEKYPEIILHLGAMKPGEIGIVLPWK